MQLSKLPTEKLKNALPYGAINEIAAKCKVNRLTVSNVINGKSKNRKVVSSINEYLLEYNRECAMLEKLVS